MPVIRMSNNQLVRFPDGLDPESLRSQVIAVESKLSSTAQPPNLNASNGNVVRSSPIPEGDYSGIGGQFKAGLKESTPALLGNLVGIGKYTDKPKAKGALEHIARFTGEQLPDLPLWIASAFGAAAGAPVAMAAGKIALKEGARVGVKALAKEGMKLGAKEAAEVATKATLKSKIPMLATKGALTFGGYEAVRSPIEQGAQKGKVSVPNVLSDILSGAALGAVGEPIGAAVSPFLKTLLKGKGTKEAIVNALSNTPEEAAKRLLENKSLGETVYEAISTTPMTPGQELSVGQRISSTLGETASVIGKLVPGMDERLVQSSRKYHLLKGEARTAIQDITKSFKVTDKEAIEVGKILDGQANKEFSLKSYQVADEVRAKAYDTMHTKANNAGLKTQGSDEVDYLSAYFPIDLNDAGKQAFYKNKGAGFIERFKELHPKATDVEAQLARSRALEKVMNRAGHIELSREIDKDIIPDAWREWDFRKVTDNYIEGFARRVSRAETFGPKDEVFTNALKAVSTVDNPDRTKLAQSLYDTIYKDTIDPNALRVDRVITKGVRNFQAATKLTMTWLRQISQSAMVHANLAPTLGQGKAAKLEVTALFRNLFKGAKKDIESLGRSINATNSDEMAKIMGADTSIVNNILKWSMFTKFDNTIREMAVEGGVAVAKNLKAGLLKNPADKSIRAELKRLFIDPEDILFNRIDDTELFKQAAWAVNKKSNFLGDDIYLPAFIKGDFAKTVTQFKAYSFRQGHELYELLVKEGLKNGNWKPMKSLMAATAAVGVPITYAYSLITGKELPQDMGDLAYRTMTFGGPGYGMLGELESTKFGRGGLAQSLLGPTGGDLATLATTAVRTGQQGNLKPLRNEIVPRIVRPIPILGPTIAGILKNSYAAQKKKEKKGKR